MVGLVAMLLAGPAWAVKPATWVHDQPKDFSAGELKNVVVSSQGEVMLSRESKTLLDAAKQAETINALAQSEDGVIYAASGPNGHIFRIKGDNADTFATLPDGNVFSLVFAKDGRLLAGTGGEKAKIYAIDAKGKATVFFEPSGAKYVWAMARGPKGEIYAATGTEGQLFVVDADGKNGKVLADLKPKNLLSMAFGRDGMIYLGTDEDGLVYRINPASGKPYVMYDAAEAEISSITVDDEGNIYAATAAADQARPGRSVADKPGGKPDGNEKDAKKSATSQPAGGKVEPKAAKSDEDGGDESKPEKAEAKPARKLSIVQSITTRLSGGKPTAQGASASAGGASAGGNAIYRIDTFGFVTEVFREPVMILDLAENEGTIYAVTGNEGRVYAITPKQDSKLMIAKLDSTQATSLLLMDDGNLVVGSANAAKIMQLTKGFAAKGTLVSKPQDASQIVKWGRVKWDAVVPTGTKLTIATRSGNVGEDESDAWDDWSPEMDATLAQQIASPGARFLQYRLTFETSKPDVTAKLTKLSIARVEENRPPLVSGLEVLSAVEEAKKPTSNPKVKQLVAAAGASGESETPVPQIHYVVKWNAEDPNQDTLMYQVFYRQVGQTKWIRIAKELKETLHIWDTRTVPDGRYEVRVVADDRLDNPAGSELQDARVSDPFIVDNTPPEVTINSVERVGKSTVRIHATATDQFTAIAEANSLVDSQEEGRAVEADDEVFDSLEEPFTVNLPDLEPGDHWVSIRVTDDHGNSRYVTQSVTAGE
jgi:outer membrane protein assembly factor BamB